MYSNVTQDSQNIFFYKDSGIGGGGVKARVIIPYKKKFQRGFNFFEDLKLAKIMFH